MRRRRYLRALSLGGATCFTGCTEWLGGQDTATPAGTPSETPPTPATRTPTRQGGTDTPEPGRRFGTVIDVVEDLGVDPTGTEPIDAALRDAAGDDTLLRFPPGQYLATEMLVLEDVQNFGVVGTGPSRADVRIVHPERFAHQFLNIRSGRDCLVRNLTLEQTPDEVTNSGLVVLNSDGVVIEDVEVGGFTPMEEQGSVDLSVHVTSPEGQGVVRRFISRDGGMVGVYPASYPGFFSGPEHVGTLQVIDCHLELCGSNGLYASRTEGGVHVRGGLFKNNDVAQVRLSGKDSTLEDARIVVDTSHAPRARGSFDGVRGVWWESGTHGKTGGHVERCDFACLSASGRRGLLQIDGTAGGMTVRNSRFRVDAKDYYAIFTREPGTSPMGGPPSKPWDVTVENVSINGASEGYTAIQLNGRPGSTIRDTAIVQRGVQRDGVRIENSAGTRLVRTDIVADRYPVLVNNTRGGTGNRGSCILRLESPNRMQSVALDPPEGDLVELSAGTASSEGIYCVDLDELSIDRGQIAIAGIEDDTVYLLGVGQTTE